MNARKEAILGMLKDTPADAFLIYALALEELKDGDTVKAIHLLEELRQQQPEYTGTYYQLGKLYEQQEHWDKAITIYKLGITQAKAAKADKIHRELAEALLNLEDPD